MANDNLNIKVILDNSQVDTSIAGLKKSFRELSTLAGSSILSNEDKTKVLVRMGEIQNKIQDTRKTIRSLDDDNVFENMAQVVGPLTATFTAAGSALSLFGIENEKVNEILVKTTQLTVALSSLQQVADARKLKNMLVARAEQLKSFVVDKLTFNITKEKAAANIAEATTKGVATAATKLATRAQLAWNAAITANPIMLLVAAVAALVTGIVLLSRAFSDTTEEVKDYEVAIDGAIIKNEELRESHNQSVLRIQDLETEYKVLTGVLTETEGEIEKLHNNWKAQTYEIKNTLKKELDDIKEKYTSFWHKAGVALKTYFWDETASLKDSIKQKEETNAAWQKYNTQYTDNYKEMKQKETNINVKSRNDAAENEKKKTEEAIRRSKERAAEIRREAEEYKKNIQDAVNKSNEYLKGNADFLKYTLDREFEYLKEFAKSLGDEDTTSKILLKWQNNMIDSVIGAFTDGKNEFDNLMKEMENSAANPDFKDKIESLFKLPFEKVKETFKTLQTEADKSSNVVVNALSEIIKVEERFFEASKNLEEKGIPINLEVDIPGIPKEVITSEAEYVEYINKAKVALLGMGDITKDNTKVYEAYKLILDLIIQQMKNKNELDVIDENTQKKKQENVKKLNDLYIERNRLYSEINYSDLMRLENNLELVIERRNQNIEVWRTERIEDEKQQYEQGVIDEKTYQENLLKIDKEYHTSREDALKSYVDSVKQIEVNLTGILQRERDVKVKALNDEGQAYKEQQNIIGKNASELTEEQRLYLDNIQSQIILIQQDTDAAIIDLQARVKYLLNNLGNMKKIKIKIGGKNFEIAANELHDLMLDTISGALTGIGDLIGRNLTQGIENQIDRMSKYYESEYESLQNLKDAELITEQEYNDKKQQLDEEKAKKEKELKIRQFKAEQQASIINVAMNAAVAIMKAWATSPITAPFITAIIATQAAIETALIKAQPMPEYEVGGKIEGVSHKAGGVPLVAEGGEYIVRKEIVKRPGVEQFLNKLNYGIIPEFATGGLIKTMTNSSTNIYNNNNYSTTNNNRLDDDLLKKIVQEVVMKVSSIPVVNVETDYTKVQRKVQSIETRRLF